MQLQPWLTTALVGLFTLATAPAHAHEWSCRLSADALRLNCAVLAEAVEATVVATVNGTHFPLDPRRVWVVELWSVPDDMAFVEQLARATICYRTPECTVRVEPQRRA